MGFLVVLSLFGSYFSEEDRSGYCGFFIAIGAGEITHGWDGTMACGMVLSGRAFGGFSDKERQVIWSRMQRFDGLIPSLYTFFEDLKYLEACAYCVKRLCGLIDISI